MKIKNSLGRLTSRMKMTEEKDSKLEDQLTEIIQYEKQGEKKTKKKMNRA